MRVGTASRMVVARAAVASVAAVTLPHGAGDVEYVLATGAVDGAELPDEAPEESGVAL